VLTHPLINPERLTEMRRTPQFISWQQELWLCHCDDFMIYKGTWEPNDFYKNSEDGDGRALFMQMTDKELNNLWDDSLPENETLLKEWYPTYYVFECSHCGKLRGNWDCD
ncbi:MAG: CbrC family protein, partial [Mucilaginibacter sp.]